MELKDLSVSGECRDIGHAWKKQGDTVLLESGGEIRKFARTLVCTRCETVRVNEYSLSRVSLTRGRSRYIYPTGYRIAGGAKVADVRFLLFSNETMVVKEEDHNG